MNTNPDRDRRQTVEYFVQCQQPDGTWEQASSTTTDLPFATDRLAARRKMQPEFTFRLAQRNTIVVVQPLADCPSCEAGVEHTEHCPTPETHNWGCGCPSDVAAAIASCPGYEMSPSPCRCPCEGCKHHCAAHNPDADEAQQPEPEAEPTAEEIARANVLALHQIGEQLAGIESWMWEHLADVREAAKAQPAVSGPCVAGEQQNETPEAETPTTTKPETAADRDTLRRKFGDVLRHWGLLDEQIDQKAAEEYAVTDLLALLPEQTSRDAENEHLRDRLTSCRERVGIAADKAIAAEDAIARARQARRRLTSALIAVEPLLTEPYPDDPRWTPWTRFVGPALKELSDALKTGPAANDEPPAAGVRQDGAQQ